MFAAAASEGRLRADDRSGALRFRSLDAWRGICALCVAAFHLKTVGWINTSAVIAHASRFVDFFFVLSGFVIAHAYRARLESGGWRSFLIRRVGRLWPLHLATLAITVVMAIAGSFLGLRVRTFDFSTIPANITMTHAWGYLNRLTWNGPSWSISAEMFAYAAFAFMALTVRGRRLDVACLVIFVTSYLVLAFVAPELNSTVDFSVFRCLFGFMAGVLACRVWQVTAWRPRGEIVAVGLALAGVAFLPQQADALVVPLFVWTVLVFASDAGPVSRALHRPFPQLLGKVSYSIYMDHYIVGLTVLTALTLFTGLTAEVYGIRTIVTDPWLADAITLAYLAIVVGVSCLTYAWVERPGRRWFNARSEPIPAAW